MSPKTKLDIFTGSVIIIGLSVVATGLAHVFQTNIYHSVIFFVLLSIISESYIIQITEDKYISTGFAVGLAGILCLDPYAAALVNFLGTVLKVYKEDGQYFHIFNSSLYKRGFNGSAYAISALTGGWVYHYLDAMITFDQVFTMSVIGILGSIITYVLINVVIFMSLYAIIDSRSPWEILREMRWIISNFVGIAPLGVLMAIAYQQSGWFIVALILGPLVMARYSFKLYIDMKQQYFETIKALSNAIEAKDRYTNGHSMRVADMSAAIASELKMPLNQIEVIKTAALLHDIGKIGISDAIINKPSKLEIGEFYEIQRHPEIGETILRDVRALKQIGTIVRHHHERYDGNGYPDSLVGEAIPIESAIITVADAYDAMTSNRVYRSALPLARAIEILKEESGRQYNPVVVDAFLKCLTIEANEQTNAQEHQTAPIDLSAPKQEEQSC